MYQNRFWIMVQQVEVPCLSISIKVVLHFNYIARGDVFLSRRFLMEMRVVRLHGVTAARRWGAGTHARSANLINGPTLI